MVTIREDVVDQECRVPRRFSVQELSHKESTCTYDRNMVYIVAVRRGEHNGTPIS